MKSFIYKVIIFIIPLVLYFACVSYYYKFNLTKRRLPKGITTIIIGDSHGQCAFNDSIIKGSINISKSSQHYLYTYNILNYMVKYNPQIKEVILACSFHTFNEGINACVFDIKESSIEFPYYFSIIDNETKLKILLKNPIGIVMAIPAIYQNELSSIFVKNKSYSNEAFCGKYYPGTTTNHSEMNLKNAINRHYFKLSKQENGFSSDQELFLFKIVDLCFKNRIKLFIVNTPISSEYRKNIPEKFILHYYSVINRLRNKVIFWDFHSYNLRMNDFGDADHLNFSGAMKFSKVIYSIK
jgi:hypothetical protein